MRRFILTAVLSALFAAASHAEPVRVLSGEHEDFSRVVLVFQNPVGWSHADVRGGFEIRFDRSGLTPNLDAVFQKIPKDRIHDIAFDPDTNTLRLESDCDCSMDVFEAGHNTIAIDVRSDEPAEEREAPSAGFTFSSTPFPFGAPQSPVIRSMQGAGLSAATAFTMAPSFRSSPGTSTFPKHASRVGALERALFEQLGRAASQGIAEIVDPTPVPDGGEPVPEATGVHHTQTRAQHIRSRTVFDPTDGSPVAADQPEFEKPVCLGERLPQIPQYAETSDPSAAISRARAKVASEFDTPAAEEIEELVRAYLTFGFGAEARAVISEFGGVLEQEALYRAMARIVDNEPADDVSALSRSLTCDDQTALWAFAAQTPMNVPETFNLESVQRWFVRLPDPLRTQLGPMIVENLLAAGYPGEADIIRNAMARTSASSSAQLKTIDASAALDNEQPEIAVKALKQLVSEPGAHTPEAMGALLKALRESGALSAEDVLTAEAVAFEHRDTEAGSALLEEIALSWSNLKAFEAAWQYWDKVLVRTAPRPRPDPLFSRISLELVRSGKDGAILTFAHSQRFATSRDSLSRESTLALAGWLLETGAPREAATLVTDMREDNALEIRHLRARIALETGEPALALSLIAAEEDAESLALRARAVSALGDHEGASALYARASMTEDAAHESLLAEQLPPPGGAGSARRVKRTAHRTDAEVDNGFQPRRDAAEQDMNVNGDESLAVSGEEASLDRAESSPEVFSLEHGRSLIARSQKSRDAVAALLEVGTLPDNATQE